MTPNGSQDTYASTPGATCDNAQLKADQSLGASIADGFSLEGFPAAAALLAHFLTGTGTEIDYRLGSTISNQARVSAGFQTVNDIVLREIALQLKAATPGFGSPPRSCPRCCSRPPPATCTGGSGVRRG